MKFEVTHDSIAKQVNEKASTNAKARKKAKALVDYALRRYQERSILLTQDELDQVRPFQSVISFDAKEEKLITESQKALRKSARRKFILNAVLVVSLLVLGIISLAVYTLNQTNNQLDLSNSLLKISEDQLKKKNEDLVTSKDSIEQISIQLDSALRNAQRQKAIAEENERIAIQEKERAEAESKRADFATLSSQANEALSQVLFYKYVLKDSSAVDKYKEQGLTYCDQMIKANPNASIPKLLKAKILVETSDYKQALELLQDVKDESKGSIPNAKVKDELKGIIKNKSPDLMDEGKKLINKVKIPGM